MTRRNSAFLALGAAAATHALPAAGSTPAEMWIDVDRIVIACAFEGVESAAARSSICDQLAAQVREVTSYPVDLASKADLSDSLDARAQQRGQLLLHFAVQPVGRDKAPPALMISVQPEKLGFHRWQGMNSPPARIALSWSGGAPSLDAVPALAGLLGRTVDLHRAPMLDRQRL